MSFFDMVHFNIYFFFFAFILTPTSTLTAAFFFDSFLPLSAIPPFRSVLKKKTCYWSVKKA